MKLIRGVKNYILGTDPVQAKKLVESLPQGIKVNMAKPQPAKIKAALEAVGGTVVLETSAEDLWSQVPGTWSAPACSTEHPGSADRHPGAELHTVTLGQPSSRTRVDLLRREGAAAPCEHPEWTPECAPSSCAPSGGC